MKSTPFNKDDPEIWFHQLEAQFGLSGVNTDGTKYGYLIAALDSDTIKKVRDKILNPPPADTYLSLKQSILERLSESAKIKLDRLVSGLQLGDKKPSELLREMQVLSSDQFQEPALRNLWLNRLPVHSQEILSCMENANLSQLATAADKILEVQSPVSVYKITNHQSNQLNQNPPIVASDVDILSRIDALSKRMEDLFSNQNSYNSHNSRASSSNFDHSRRSSANSNSNRFRPRSNSNQRNCSRPNPQKQPHPNCWYHFKYGLNAKQCQLPCQFEPKPNPQVQGNF